MIHSMTGFGGASFRANGAAFELEVRSVNHRHLDVRIRLPRPLAALEAPIRARVQELFSRGKFDLNVVQPEGAILAHRLEIDLDAARAYLDAARTLAEEADVTADLRAAEVLALPGVARFAEPDLSAETTREPAMAGLEAALEALASMRAAEGAALERDLSARLTVVSALAGEIEQRADLVQASVRERLRKRARQLESETGLLDEARLHQEVTLAAERLDITEEVVRLRSHIDQFRDLIGEAGPGRPVGRKLDFLLQEFGREANTMGSKGNDAPVAHFVVDLKSEIERLREQVQNVE